MHEMRRVYERVGCQSRTCDGDEAADTTVVSAPDYEASEFLTSAQLKIWSRILPLLEF